MMKKLAFATILTSLTYTATFSEAHPMPDLDAFYSERTTRTVSVQELSPEANAVLSKISGAAKQTVPSLTTHEYDLLPHSIEGPHSYLYCVDSGPILVLPSHTDFELLCHQISGKRVERFADYTFRGDWEEVQFLHSCGYSREEIEDFIWERKNSASQNESN